MTQITKTEKSLIEAKNYLRRCENHIFFIERLNTYFRVSLQEDKFIVHTLHNEIISTREYFFVSIFANTTVPKYFIKYILFNKGVYDKVISVKKRKNLVF